MAKLLLASFRTWVELFEEAIVMFPPLPKVLELSMNPSTVVALKEFMVILPAVPAEEVLMIFGRTQIQKN